MTDKEAYEAAVKLVEAPRCITCEHYQTGGKAAACVMHGPIPVEFLYTPNDCKDYDVSIPF